MAVQSLPHPQTVADAFVEQYYAILYKRPDQVHKFYQESSLLGWPGSDRKPVTTLSGINEKIMSSDYKSCPVEIITVDAQESLEGAVIVSVAGLLTGKDNVKKNFNQTFFLAKQEKGFFVLNDILRFSNVCESIISCAVNDDEQDQAASFVPAVPSTISESQASNTEVVKKENNKQALAPSVSKDTDSKVTVSRPFTPSGDKVPPVLKPSSDAKVEAPKPSYASMVVKGSPLSSPKAVIVSSNADNRVVTPSTTKASSPRVDDAPKAATASNVVSKASVPPSNVRPKSPIASNGAPNTNPEVRGIYVGGLPYDITKQGVAEVMKIFGPVRRSPDSIRLRRHEDGFCCGFVEFESAEGAHRAVQAHYVHFGDKEAYITHKRSYNQGNGRGRSPTRGKSQNGNFRGQENGEVTNKQRSQSGNHNNNRQARGARQNRKSDQIAKGNGRETGSNRSVH